MTVVHELHAANHSLTVTLIKDEDINVNRGALLYGLDPQRPVSKFLLSNKLVTLFGAELVIDRVHQIEPDTSRLTTASGTTYTYDQLVLATGARPMFPPIPGLDAPEVLTIRWKYELFALREALQRSPRIIVVSSDYIGLEAAAILHTLGAHVTLCGLLPSLLAGTIETEYSQEVEQYIAAYGIALKTNSRVAEILCTDGHVSGAYLDDGTLLEADFVVLSLGNEPETDLASRSGIHASKFGIVTDDYLRTNVKNIYATGDCAEKKSLLSKQPVVGNLDVNAVCMSKIVAANILGNRRVFPGVINACVFKVFDLCYGCAGLSEIAAKAVFDVVSGYSEVMNKYPMLDGATPVKTKLIFERDTERLVGGSVLRYAGNVAADVELLSLAMQFGATAEQLLTLQYPAHPELTSKPTENRFILAAQDALKKLL